MKHPVKARFLGRLWMAGLMLGGVVLGLPGAHAQDAKDAGTVSLAFVGDVMLADTPGRVIARGQDPLRFFAPLLDQADVRIANLECVVATVGDAEPDKPWTFRAQPRTLKVLQAHFDAVGLANNHSGDYGPQAFAQMLDLLDASPLRYFGGGKTLAQAHTPLIVVRKGLRIALLGYSEFFPRSFEADFNKPGTAWSEDEQVVLDIARARSVYHADVVIPVMHWGWELEPVASDRQRFLARLMIDAGADAVVGGHPHVTESVDQYKGKPIIYSLGNFVFDGFHTLTTTTGWMLRLDVSRAGAPDWKIFTAQLDRDGTPHPQSTQPTLCWDHARPERTDCVATP